MKIPTVIDRGVRRWMRSRCVGRVARRNTGSWTWTSKRFFDSVDHDLMVKAVAVNTDQPWVVLYVKRWLTARDCSGPRPRVVIGWPWSGCEGSVRDRAVLRAAGGAGVGPGTDDRSAAGPNRRAGCGDRRAEAAVGRPLAQLLQAAVERRAGQAGAEVAARPVGAQARRAAGAGGPHAAADRAAG